MSTPYYDIYINQVFSLAKTLVIHSSATAAAMNAAIKNNATLALAGISVDDTNPSSWKYYMNLQGVYHPSDTPMSVVSLDTLQTIAFTVQNLQANVATAKAYAFGSSYYNALVAKYPLQENLILGILNPVTFRYDANGDIVIPADGTILWYDSTQVEANETNLISYLQDWFNMIFDRWDNPAYNLTDDLYAAAQLGMMFSFVPLEILNIRLRNCKTRFVHSFHIRQYLASNGGLDKYMDLMTIGQRLWLYRNIQYIKRNAGKQSTFQWLLYNILTIIGLPLAEWNYTQSTENMPGDLLPTPQFSRRPLNFGFSVTGTDTRTLEEIFDLEVPLARDNALVESDDITLATTKMENSKINALKTKVLESSVLDLTDAQPYTLSNCLLNQWMYWAYSGRYRTIINLVNPHTGNPFNMPVLDAFILYLYAYNKGNGISLTYIPLVSAEHVQRIPQPTIPELEYISDVQYIDTTDLYKVLANLPVIGVYISTEGFYNACLDIQDGILAGRELYCAQVELNARAQMEIVTQRCYCDVQLPLDGGVQTSYASWLLQKGYSFPGMTADDWTTLAKAIITEATGIDLLNTRNLRDLQAAMLAVMTQLSSYSIQYIQTINDSPIKVVDWNALRLGNMLISTSDDINLGMMAVDVIELDAAQDNLFLDDLFAGVGLDIAIAEQIIVPMAIPLDVDFDLVGNMTLLDRWNIGLVEWLSPPDEVVDLASVAVNLLSPDYVPLALTELSQGFTTDTLDDYAALTQQDRQTLLDRFMGALSTPIGSLLHTYILDGLVVPTEPFCADPSE